MGRIKAGGIKQIKTDDREETVIIMIRIIKVVGNSNFTACSLWNRDIFVIFSKRTDKLGFSQKACCQVQFPKDQTRE